MKFYIKRDTLLPALQHLQGAAERRQNLPIYSHVLLSLHESLLTLTATNTEIEISETIIADEVIEGGSITVSAQKLNEIVRVLPADSLLEFELEKQRMHLTCDRSQFTLQTLPAEDFPLAKSTISYNTQVKLPQNELRRLIENVYFSIAQQDVRFYLNGMVIDLQGHKLATIASDGHRLALSTGRFEGKPYHQQVIIPRKSVIELMKLLDSSEDEVELYLSDSQAKLIIHQIVFVTKLIDSKFPPYEALIPKGNGLKISVTSEDLKKMLQRVAIIASDKSQGVRFLLSPGKLVIVCRNSQQEEAIEALDIVYNDREVDIAYNISYFLDILTHQNASLIHLNFFLDNNSALVYFEGYENSMHVVMPMRM